MTDTLTIAVSKGRILKDAMPLLKHAGVELVDDPATSRKLILDTTLDHVKIVLIRATDVPTFVQYGAADMGIVGKDTLLEHGGEGLYEPLDLKIAPCKLMVAGKPEMANPPGRLRIATKYVESAKQYYAAQGRQVEIIKLYGSMELAPLVGLADLIVDLVDTGNTLKANGLVPMEHIVDISSRLIVNKASMKMKHKAITQFVDQMAEAVALQNS